MALNKQFIHFQTKSAFNEQKENISDTSIAFIKETREIYTHDQLYGSISVASSTANGLMPKEHYSIIDKESNNQLVTELSNNVSTTADKVYIQYKSRYFGDDLRHDNICNILSATSTNAGVMSATDKRKLDSLSNYTLPTANSSTLGGIKIGSGLNIDSNGTVSVDNKLYILVNSLESVSTPDANKIYLVLNSSSTSETNSFTEYVWITSDTGGKWEKLGEFKTDVDLTPYAKTADVTSAIDAVRESVATHDTVIGKLTRNKAEWFDAGYITEDTCYNIVTGAQPSVTLPLDASELLDRFRAVASRTRLYVGVRFTVQGKEDVCLYLKFAAISPYADSGAVVFEDLQFCYSPTKEGVEDIDVRYKVRTDKSTGYIVLEKVEESASLPWLEINTQDDLYNGIVNLNPGEKFELVPQSTDINPNEDLSKYCGLRLHDTYDNVWYLPWAYILDDRSEYDTCPFMFNGKTLRAEVIGASVWFINNDPDLSDYAKKTDVETALSGMVKIQKLTQEEYDALKTKDENVLYAIIEPATEG